MGVVITKEMLTEMRKDAEQIAMGNSSKQFGMAGVIALIDEVERLRQENAALMCCNVALMQEREHMQ